MIRWRSKITGIECNNCNRDYYNCKINWNNSKINNTTGKRTTPTMYKE